MPSLRPAPFERSLLRDRAVRPMGIAAAVIAVAAVAGCAVPGAGRPAADAEVLHNVAEDDHVRVEELRVRGLPQRIDVHPKDGGLPDYRIVTPPGGQDASQAQGGTTGRRVWPVLSF